MLSSSVANIVKLNKSPTAVVAEKTSPKKKRKKIIIQSDSSEDEVTTDKDIDCSTKTDFKKEEEAQKSENVEIKEENLEDVKSSVKEGSREEENVSNDEVVASPKKSPSKNVMANFFCNILLQFVYLYHIINSFSIAI